MQRDFSCAPELPVHKRGENSHFDSVLLATVLVGVAEGALVQRQCSYLYDETIRILDSVYVCAARDYIADLVSSGWSLAQIKHIAFPDWTGAVSSFRYKGPPVL